MVGVSLLELVRIKNTAPVWPERFRELVAKLEDDLDERSQWGVIADWCDENEEPLLGVAFRWVMRHPGVLLTLRNPDSWDRHYMWVGMPGSVLSAVTPEPESDWTTVPGRVATLALQLLALKNLVA